MKNCGVYIVMLYINMNVDQIRDILAFREKVTKTGMKPSETLEEAMCKELHPSCYMKKKVSRKNDDL